MWIPICAILVFLSLSYATNTYVVVVPKTIRSGLPLNVNVNILNATGPVTVVAKVTAPSGGTVIANGNAGVHQDDPATITLQIPKSVKSGSYKISVHGTGGATFDKETSITCKEKSLSIFIQTDKAVYKPSQTVHFRALGIHPDLKPYLGTMDIEIFDPKGNKIKQWHDLRDNKGVVTSQLGLSDQPIMGDWKIKVTLESHTEEKAFTVDEYVLPKFEVTVDLPAYGLTKDLHLSGTVKAKYTYGKGVKGMAKIRARLQSRKDGQPSVEKTMQLEDGAKAFTFHMAELHHLGVLNLNGKVVVVEANVTESLTDNVLNGSNAVKYYDHAAKLEFISSNAKNFKPGLKYTAYLKVSKQDGLPIVGQKSSVQVTVTVTKETKSTILFGAPHTSTHTLITPTFAVPDNGLVPIEIDVPKDKESTKITVTAHYPDAADVHLDVDRMHSPSDSYIQILLQSTSLIHAGDVAHFDLKTTEAMTTATYQVLSRGSIVSSGKLNTAGRQSENFGITMTSKMAPTARIIVYYVRGNGEIVTDSISFNVEGVFENQVSVSFNSAKVQPGDQVDIQVHADPNSLVNLLAVDQSVLLLKSGNDITEAQVTQELQTYDTIDVKHHQFPAFNLFHNIAFRQKRMMWWRPYYPVYFDGVDAEHVFSNAGVLVLTDATVYHHKPPVQFGGPIHWGDIFKDIGGIHFQNFASANHQLFGPGVSSLLGQGAGAHVVVPQIPKPSGGGEELKDVSRIRKVFPETWLWTSQTIGSNGSTVISTTVPDTITSWVASAFAVNTHSGFGVSSTTAKLEVFRPFFVSMNLPYCVVRGEQVVLQALVFNYMTADMRVVVTLEGSSAFRSLVVDHDGNSVASSEAQSETVQIKAGEAKSVFFPIVPAGLGNIDITVKAQSNVAADAVQRQLLVEPEGAPREYNQAVLIDLTHNTSFTKTLPISFPETTVQGSKHVTVSAIGDLMGPTIHGLSSLLRMPTGCGEQTMLSFAPDIFVCKYLSATKQLSGAIKDKAIGFLEKGYQRELTYQHHDGSFSAFGDKDASGSMWLTAFVIKSFHQAKSFIYVDDKMTTKAINWIISRQHTDGSFPEPGRIIHKNMQGGSASGEALTAFVLIALLENNDLETSVQVKVNAAVDKARSYLESQVGQLNRAYDLAITTYALTLAHSHQASSALTRLNSGAITKDGLKYWKGPANPVHSTHTFWRAPNKQATASDIETTAYGLLSYAEHQDLVNALSIMKWITAQRNAHGGFSSTQDTVLALQALSEFAQSIYSPNFDVQLHVSDDSSTRNFHINKDNALVFQTHQLEHVTDHVSLSASGHGMALVQVSVDYHVEQDELEPSFDVHVRLLEETVHSLKVETCSRWLKVGSSGMAVEEIGIPSGFQVDTEDIDGVHGLKRIEQANRKIIFYFDQITTEQTCLTVTATRTDMVAKSQPVAVRLYDYYEPDNQVTVFYQSQLLKHASICDVCGTDCGCV